MINLIGLELSEAKKILQDLKIDYSVIEYSSTKPLEDTDCTRVVKYSVDNKTAVLTVSRFKTIV